MELTNEIKELAYKAVRTGADVYIDYDESGNVVTVKVFGLKGCGTFPMSPISAAERLRELV